MLNVVVFRNLDLRMSDDVLVWPADCGRFYRHPLRSRCGSLRIAHEEFCVSGVKVCNQKQMVPPVKSYACSAGLFIRMTIKKLQNVPASENYFTNWITLPSIIDLGYRVAPAIYQASSSLSKHPFGHNIISIRLFVSASTNKDRDNTAEVH